MSRFLVLFIACVAVLAASSVPLAAQTAAGFDNLLAGKQELIEKGHWRFEGNVEIEKEDWKFYADVAEYFEDAHRLVGSGNVLFVQKAVNGQGANQIAAERCEFDTEARTGTFYVATGQAAMADKVDRAMFGGQEPDMYFRGETVEKIGDRKYRITRGGFTTCVQPTPRWEMTSGSVVINLDHYALLKNPVLKVKNVPLFYFPFVYYPIKKENRATGFLLPMYGRSTFQGFRLSNAFFWAVNRSQDVTFYHDWYSKTGQGVGAEYRYVMAPGAQGDIRVYVLNEKATAAGGGSTSGRSYEIRGSLAQGLGGHLRARGRVDYFSSITVQQLYNTNIYDASRRQRSVNGNLAGNWGPWGLNATYDRTEYFFGTTNSTLTGSTPRVSFSRSERPIAGTPVYFSFGTEFSNIPRINRTPDLETNTGLARFDVSPGIRVPFTRWQFLTINSSVNWRGTYYTESRNAAGRQVPEGLIRQYVDFSSRIVGPVLTRIFNTPNSGHAEKLKHTIEPYLNLQHITPVDNFDRIVQNDWLDAIVGNNTRVSYGLNNRLYAKPKRDDRSGAAREILNVTISQSYYTDALAAQYDRAYSTSFSGTTPSHFSPLALALRASPADSFSASMRAEYDTQYRALRTIGANGNYAVGGWLRAGAGWSQSRYIPGLPGFNDPNQLSNYLNGLVNLRLAQNRFGGAYSFNYDLTRNTAGVPEGTTAPRRGFLQQRVVGYYNAQCCGFAVEYQMYNFQGTSIGSSVPKDRRLNFSFTLAGLGTFSNFFGALGGAMR
jgi:lipopolysaccharide assembly outer membrane protein LptD (OstA)